MQLKKTPKTIDFQYDDVRPRTGTRRSMNKMQGQCGKKIVSLL